MRVLYYATFFLAVICLGCVTTNQGPPKGVDPVMKPAPPPPAVTPGQVNQENAHQVSQALWDEMDRQAQNELLPEPKVKTPPSKK